MVETALQIRQQKPMFLLDLAVPRDIEADVATQPNVQLFNIDDLHEIVDENFQNRHAAAQQAEQIIETELQFYMYKLKCAKAGDVIRQYRTKMESLGELEIERALNAIEHGQQIDITLRDLTRRLINKLAHQPSIQLREASARGDVAVIDDYLRNVYETTTPAGEVINR